MSDLNARLKSAVRSSGGNLAVAKRCGMPVGTLNRYLAGREMRVASAVSIAAACDVSLLWLITGDGIRFPGGEASEPEADAPPAAPPKAADALLLSSIAEAVIIDLTAGDRLSLNTVKILLRIVAGTPAAEILVTGKVKDPAC